MSTPAFFLVVLAAVMHATWNLAAKKAAHRIGTYWLGLAMAGAASVIATLPLLPVKECDTRGMVYFILTGVFHLLYFAFLIMSYRTTEFSSAYPFARGLGVMGTAVLGILLLGESATLPGTLGIGCILLGITGIGLVRDIPLMRNLKNLAYAALVGVTIICYSLVDKQGVRYMDPVMYSMGIFFLPALMLAPYVLAVHRADVRLALKAYKTESAVIGLGSFGTYLIILHVFQTAPVSHVVPVRESSVAIGALYGILLLKEKASAGKLLAIAAITAGLILIKLS